MSEVARLGTLAERINAEHRACQAAARTSLEHAMNAGDLLIEAKAECPHGTWQDWFDANLKGSLSLRTAQVYMYLARRREEVGEAKAQSSALTSIAHALHLLSFRGPVLVPPEELRAAPEPLPLEYPAPSGDVWEEHREAMRTSYIHDKIKEQAKKGDPNPPPDMEVEVSDEYWRKWYAYEERQRRKQGVATLGYVLEALHKNGLGDYWAIRAEEAGQALAHNELAFMENNERVFEDLRAGVAWLQQVIGTAEQEQRRMQGDE
jgi:hypothetical protein